MRNLARRIPVSTHSAVVALALLFMVSACATAPRTGDNKTLAQNKFREAVEFAALNMKQEMISRLEEAVELDPENVGYRLNLGTAHFHYGDLEAAKRHFLKVLEINKDNKDAYRQLGRIYLRQGDWDKAVLNFNEDLKRPGTPSPQRVYNWLALSYYNLGRVEEAEKKWLEALEIRENAGIRLNLGLAYKNQERFKEALESFKVAVSLDPQLSPAHYEMALLYLKNGNRVEAVDHFERVLNLEPKSERAESAREYLSLLNTNR